MSNVDPYQQAIEYYSQRIVSHTHETFYDLWHDGYAWKGRAVLVPLNIWGGFLVARGKNSSGRTQSVKAAWNTTFVDIPLVGVTEDEIFGHFENVEVVYDAATELLESGYRLGFSYNPQNDAFICSVTCKDDNSENANKTFTSFAGAWYDALVVALYKHRVVAKGVWAASSSALARPKFG